MNYPDRNLNFWQLPKPLLCLAPMAGITDSAFRLVCKQNGADVVYSEMASASALYFKPKRTLDLLRFSPDEKPYVVQLFGKEPIHFARAAQIISQGIPLVHYSSPKTKKVAGIAPPSGIDINFGCPAKKVFRHGSGCALMTNPCLAKKIIQAVRQNTTLPLSIKVRAGVGAIQLINFLKKIDIDSLGIQALMIHGRTYEQGFTGEPDYSVFREARQIFNGIIIANGGIKDFTSGQKMLQESKADGLGVATGSFGRPFIFQELSLLKKKPVLGKFLPDQTLIQKIALEHAQYLHILKGSTGILESRKHLLWYFKGFPGAKKFRQQIVSVNSLPEIKDLIQKINA